MDAFKLINMNGRVYDPVMGHFLSPDPFCNAGITTGYNRYSYCQGNPLNRIDPSGYIDIMGSGDIDKTGGAVIWSIGYFDNGYHRGDNSYGPGNESVFPVYGLYNSPKDQFEYDFQLGQNIAATGGTTGYLFGVLSAGYHGQYGEYFSGPNAVSDATAYLDNFTVKPMEVASSSIMGSFLKLCNIGLDHGGYIRITGNNSRGGVDDKLLFTGSTLLDLAEEYTFSRSFNTWMGKDFKIRSQSWGGNGYTGGKIKFAYKTSRYISFAGKFVGFWGLYNTYQDGRQGITTPLQTSANGLSDLAGIFLGIYGAAWSFGWEAGKLWGPSKWGGQCLMIYQKKVAYLTKTLLNKRR